MENTEEFKGKENGGQCFKPITTGKWETCFKGLLTENRERYLGEQETGLEGMNDIVKMTVKSLKCNTSCGVGGVPGELLKSGTEKLC